MNRLFKALFTVVLVLTVVEGYSADRVKKVGEKKPWDCEITKTSPDTITVDRNGITDEVLVTEIESIQLDGEPAEFKSVRENLKNGQNEDARDTLNRVKEGNLQRNLLVMERGYLLAMANAKIALSGGDVKLQTALDGLKTFLDKYPKYFRIRDIQQIYGNMCLQMNKSEEARKCFQDLSKCKSSSVVRARGFLGVSTVAIAKGDAKEAEKALESVKSLLDAGELNVVKKEMDLSYKLGLARCYALKKDFDKALNEAQSVINDSSPEDVVNNANAYNTMGIALVMQEKPKDAIVAFLHTHLLYNNDPTLHMEALTNMVQQWRKLGNNQRAQEMETLRMERYGK